MATALKVVGALILVIAITKDPETLRATTLGINGVLFICAAHIIDAINHNHP